MSIASVVESMKQNIGKEVFVSDWTQVTQEQINKFADATMDHQWIHVDVEKAAKGPFGHTIAHGFLTLSHLPFFSYQVPLKFEGAKMSINYGLDKVRFLNPVASGSKIRDRIFAEDSASWSLCNFSRLTLGTSTCKSIRSNSGPDTLF